MRACGESFRSSGLSLKRFNHSRFGLLKSRQGRKRRNVAQAMSKVFTDQYNGRLLAFWQDDDGVAFYDPGNFTGAERYHIPFTKMNFGDTQYSDAQSAQFEDIVNRVWRYRKAFVPFTRETTRISKMKPGRYHPRIWRGLYNVKDPFPNKDLFSPIDIYGYVYTQSVVAAESLLTQLQEFFRNIEPAAGNLQSYGHRSRELLILVCTEIEAAWRAILEGNLKEKKGRYTTKDYVKLKAPLRLSEWTVQLENYPNLGTFSPYKDWQDDSPTQTIKWYDAYNACKHDREGCFAEANLDQLLNAMAALVVLLAAQWGPGNFPGIWPSKGPFFLVDVPSYGPDEVYLPSLDGSPLTAAAPFL